MSTTTLPSLASHAIVPPLHMSELLAQLGDIDPSRVRLRPAPGTATEEDCISANGANRTALCELIDGTLVEKAVGSPASTLAAWLVHILSNWVYPNKLGQMGIPDFMARMAGGNLRFPDISIYLWSGMPNRERYPGAIYPVAPDLAVEVLSPSNTIKEMDNKRTEYFASGCSLFWIVDPDDRTVTVYTSLTTSTRLTVKDILTGGSVLPGFSVPVKHLFSELDDRG